MPLPRRARRRSTQDDQQAYFTFPCVSPFRAAPLSPHQVAPPKDSERVLAIQRQLASNSGKSAGVQLRYSTNWCGDNGAARKGETHGKVKSLDHFDAIL